MNFVNLQHKPKFGDIYLHHEELEIIVIMM